MCVCERERDVNISRLVGIQFRSDIYRQRSQSAAEADIEVAGRGR